MRDASTSARSSANKSDQRSQVAVAARLPARRPGRLVSTESLVSELWGDNPPSTANNMVSIYVHRLRKEVAEARAETGDMAEARVSLAAATRIFEQVGDRAGAAQTASLLASLSAELAQESLG
jgi:DNA-binding SARP family transcriptional activator